MSDERVLTIRGNRATRPISDFYMLDSGHNTWFVDANVSATGQGKSWANPFLTMAEAFAAVSSGDVIRFRGKIKEQLETPVQVFDVTVIGEGNRPRHADSTPDGGQEAANSWTEPDAEEAATPLVKVQQQGWRFVNILFYGGDDNSCIQVFRDGGADDDERDGSHTEILGCRFASGYDGVEDSGGCFNVKIDGCVFMAMTHYAIAQVTGAGIGTLLQWEVTNNRFIGNVNWMGPTWSGNYNKIMNNEVLNTTTILIDTSAGANNTIVGNVFNIAAADFDPTGHVTGNATDVWSNILIDAIETGLPAD